MANDLGYVAPANAAYKDPVTVNMVQGIYDNVTAIAMLINDYSNIKMRIVDGNNIEVTSGSIMINGKLRKNTQTATVTWSNTGGNGIAETSSTGFYIWAVASGASSTFEVAINNTSASMTGNANSRLIGWFWNDTGNTIEALWYLDKDYHKWYETTWYQVQPAGWHIFHHNLNSKLNSTSIWLSSGSDPTGIHTRFWVNDSKGVNISNMTDTTFELRAQDGGLSELITTGGGQVVMTSGYVKVLMTTY
jgi:hypothetical protein